MKSFNTRFHLELLCLSLWSVFMTACQANPIKPNAPTPSPSPQPSPVPTDSFFPQQTQPHTYDTADSLGGQLILVDNCLRLQDAHRGSFLVIWPYRYYVDRGSAPMQVHNDAGQMVASVGDYIQIDGGEVSSWSPLPTNCSGPYWFMNSSNPIPIDVHFPQEAPLVLDPAKDSLTGKLVSVNDCLRLQVDEKRSFLLIWPWSFSIDRGKNSIQVYGYGYYGTPGAHDLVTQVGKDITVAGREILTEGLADYTIYPIPDECVGPYWGVVKVDPASSSSPQATENTHP